MSRTDSEAISSAQLPGSGLRQAREAAGISLPDLAKRTLIAPHRLQALECDDYEAAGGATYVKGYARAYARVLNLDPAETVRLFERELAPAVRSEPEVSAGYASSHPENRHISRLSDIIQQHKRGIIGAGLVLLIALILLAVGSDDEPPGERVMPNGMETPVNPPQETPPEPLPPEPAAPDSEPQLPAPEIPHDGGEVEDGTADLVEDDPPSDLAEDLPSDLPSLTSNASSALTSPPPITSPAAPSNTKVLEFHFTDTCWLEVVDANGERIIAREAQSGDNLRLSGSAPFSIVLGNAPAASITIDGERVDIKPRTSTNVLRLNLGGDS